MEARIGGYEAHHQMNAATIAVIPNDETGQLSVDALRQMIDDRVKLIAITHVPTNGGLVNPAAAAGHTRRYRARSGPRPVRDR